MTNQRLNILVLNNFRAANANVIRDFLFSFREYSVHNYYYCFNTHRWATRIDFSLFDVIIFFWDLELLNKPLPSIVIDRIRKTNTLKILFLQDEYRDVRFGNLLAARLGVQIIYTCVAEKDHEIFYPHSLIPSLQATYSILTGYVSKYLENLKVDYESHRPFDIVYRSRTVPYWLGDLGQEKQIVANQFQRISSQFGFHSNISVQEADRIYGGKWINFLQSGRFVLGSGSGASVIDFTGEIRRNCDNYLYKYPQASYEEVKQHFFADVDGRIVIDTISPRIFEAAACGTILILHEGPYAGILKPDHHFICVKKDYSNLEEVIAKMRDRDFGRQLAKNAYQDLVASGQYSYKTFVSDFDDVLSYHISNHRSRAKISPTIFYLRQGVLLYRNQFIRLWSPYRIMIWFYPKYLRLRRYIPLSLQHRISQVFRRHF